MNACLLRGMEAVEIPSRGEEGGGLRRTVENITAVMSFQGQIWDWEGEGRAYLIDLIELLVCSLGSVGSGCGGKR